MTWPLTPPPVPPPTRWERLAAACRALTALVGLIGLLGVAPYVMWRLIGWPLPHHIPTKAQVVTALTTPMSDDLFIDIVATFYWYVTFLLLWSVVAEAIGEILGRRWRLPFNPTSALGGVLVAALIAGVITLASRARPSTPATASTSGPLAGRPTTAAATAPAHPPAASRLYPALDIRAPDRSAGPAPNPYASATPDPDWLSHPTGWTTYTVQPGDNLWDLAQHHLGNGAYWRGLYGHNHNRPQPDGQVLTAPNLIRPGWTLIIPVPPATSPPTPRPAEPAPTIPAVPGPATPAPTPAPATPAAPSPSAPRPAGPSAAPAPTPPGSLPSRPASPPPPQRLPPPATAPGHPEVISLRSGALIGISTLAVLVAAVATARLRRRQRYVPGSGTRDDLAEGPTIRELVASYTTTTHPDPDDDDLGLDNQTAGPAAPEPAPDPPADPDIALLHQARALAAASAPTGPIVAVRDGRPIALELAARRGLGLVGPGAPAAARALLISVLADRRRPGAAPVDLLMPAADAHRLLGARAAADPPTRLRISPDLPGLLHRVEADLLTRARRAAAGESPGPRLIVMAGADPDAEQRLRGVLDTGAALGIIGIILGPWPHGATVVAGPDGVVDSVHPPVADDLTGARLVTLPAEQSDDLLDLLRDTEPADTGDAAPPPPMPPEPPPPPEPPGRGQPPPPRTPGPAPAPSPTEPEQGAAPAPPAPAAVAVTPPDEAAEPPPPAPAAPAAPRPVHPAAWLASTAPFALTLLGGQRFLRRDADTGRYEPIRGVGPKAREILAYLALHPDGASRDALAAAIWRDGDDRRLANRLYAALSQIRRSIRAATDDPDIELVDHDGTLYRLRRELIRVDLWDVQDALARRRAGDPNAVSDLATAYTGHIALDISGQWMQPYREQLRREVLDTLTDLARTSGAPDTVRLNLLEHLRELDPLAEEIYLQIASLQAHLGRHDAVPRTLSLLTGALKEVGETPSPATLAHFAALTREANAPGRRRPVAQPS